MASERKRITAYLIPWQYFYTQHIGGNGGVSALVSEALHLYFTQWVTPEERKALLDLYNAKKKEESDVTIKNLD